LQTIKNAGIPIRESAIRQGLADTTWPARFEILQREPLVIIDAAHNAYSARALRNALDQYFPEIPIVLILGFSAEKDIKGMLDAWLPRVSCLIATQSGHPRAILPEELAETIRTLTDLPVTSQPNAASALQFALETVREDQLVLATGSVFEVASVRVAWTERQARTSPLSREQLLGSGAF
jgi:dihydrofolate synthase/folylpolyglutamate synthase